MLGPAGHAGDAIGHSYSKKEAALSVMGDIRGWVTWWMSKHILKDGSLILPPLKTQSLPLCCTLQPSPQYGALFSRSTEKQPTTSQSLSSSGCLASLLLQLRDKFMKGDSEQQYASLGFQGGRSAQELVDTKPKNWLPLNPLIIVLHYIDLLHYRNLTFVLVLVFFPF